MVFYVIVAAHQEAFVARPLFVQSCTLGAQGQRELSRLSTLEGTQSQLHPFPNVSLPGQEAVAVSALVLIPLLAVTDPRRERWTQ